jgi:hypothetical protein
MRSLICAKLRVCKKRRIDCTATAPNRAAGELRQRVFAATLTVVVATMLIVGWGIANIDQARAAPMCPGPTTSDGLACCAPGSTPTGADTCQLPGGGVAASCALSQLTSSGTCCPASASPQADGSCQPANGFASAPGCPLGQLGKSGLSCCPTGQVPQADGSCQQTTAQPSTSQPSATQQPAAATPAGISACAAGFSFEIPKCTGLCQLVPNQPPLVPYCVGLPKACPAGAVAGYYLNSDGSQGGLAGCCPAGTQFGTGGDNWGQCITAGGGQLDQVPPTCPAGTTTVWDTTYNQYGVGFSFYDCQTKPACPGRMTVDPSSGMCVLNPLQLQVTPGQLQNLTVPPAQPPPSGPCPAGDERAPDGRCVRIIPGVVLPNCSAGYTMSPDGKLCVRAAGTPVGPAPNAPVGTPTAKAPGETTSVCPPGESQVPGAKPGTCKSCPSDTHPNADGACVRMTTDNPATPTTTPATKTTSPTTKLATPTRTISKPPKLLVNHPKPNLSPKPIARPRPPKKTPVEKPAKTTS